jgi:hypothetical protein
LFGDFRIKNIPKRLTPLDGKLNLKDILLTPGRGGKNASEMDAYASKPMEKKDTLDTTPGATKEVDGVAAAQQALVTPNAQA